MKGLRKSQEFFFASSSAADLNAVCIYVCKRSRQTFRDLLQTGEHLGQLLLSLCQLPSAREIYPEQSHDGVYDLRGEREKT